MDIPKYYNKFYLLDKIFLEKNSNDENNNYTTDKIKKILSFFKNFVSPKEIKDKNSVDIVSYYDHYYHYRPYREMNIDEDYSYLKDFIMTKTLVDEYAFDIIEKIIFLDFESLNLYDKYYSHDNNITNDTFYISNNEYKEYIKNVYGTTRFSKFSNFLRINYDFNNKNGHFNIVMGYSRPYGISFMSLKPNGPFFYELLLKRLSEKNFKVEKKYVRRYAPSDSPSIEYNRSELVHNYLYNLENDENIEKFFDSLKIYYSSTNVFVDMWRYCKSFMKNGVFYISSMVSYLISKFKNDEINYDEFLEMDDELNYNYKLSNVENLYNNPEVQLSLQNCDNLQFIPERVFGGTIDEGILFSTSFLFNRIAELIEMHLNQKVSDEDDFLLLSGITPTFVRFEQIEKFMFGHSSIYSEEIHINEFIMVDPKLKVKEILPILISYYQGENMINLVEIPYLKVIKIHNQYYILENQIMYFIYLILGEDKHDCIVKEFY